jgi:hypothetical protein
MAEVAAMFAHADHAWQSSGCAHLLAEAVAAETTGEVQIHAAMDQTTAVVENKF